MVRTFPEGFLWGTSTAAAQVETAGNHNWKGFRSRDGHIFDRTTDHELRREEDLEYICQFGQVYRCGVDWSKLQESAFASFDPIQVAGYRDFFSELNARGMKIMFVFHHFAHPRWFESAGGWTREENIPAFLNYAEKCLAEFGDLVYNWNTFNEPNVYAMNAYLLGNFPPRKRNLLLADKVLRTMSRAHSILFEILKSTFPQKEVGISLNTAWFDGKGLLGRVSAGITDWWFISRPARLFATADFTGISYYAYVPFLPGPITEIDQPGKLDRLGIPHDRMWGYRPEGLGRLLRRINRKYPRPIWITENGICTDDPEERIASLKNYLEICYQALENGINIKGYIHWSTWDNFEWNLGPTYSFGLVNIDPVSLDRKMTAAGLFYAEVCRSNSVEV